MVQGNGRPPDRAGMIIGAPKPEYAAPSMFGLVRRLDAQGRVELTDHVRKPDGTWLGVLQRTQYMDGEDLLTEIGLMVRAIVQEELLAHGLTRQWPPDVTGVALFEAVLDEALEGEDPPAGE